MRQYKTRIRPLLMVGGALIALLVGISLANAATTITWASLGITAIAPDGQTIYHFNESIPFTSEHSGDFYRETGVPANETLTVKFKNGYTLSGQVLVASTQFQHSWTNGDTSHWLVDATISGTAVINFDGDIPVWWKTNWILPGQTQEENILFVSDWITVEP
jgi:hypothetical protein